MDCRRWDVGRLVSTDHRNGRLHKWRPDKFPTRDLPIAPTVYPPPPVVPVAFARTRGESGVRCGASNPPSAMRGMVLNLFRQRLLRQGVVCSALDALSIAHKLRLDCETARYLQCEFCPLRASEGSPLRQSVVHRTPGFEVPCDRWREKVLSRYRKRLRNCSMNSPMFRERANAVEHDGIDGESFSMVLRIEFRPGAEYLDWVFPDLPLGARQLAVPGPPRQIGVLAQVSW